MAWGGQTCFVAFLVLPLTFALYHFIDILPRHKGKGFTHEMDKKAFSREKVEALVNQKLRNLPSENTNDVIYKREFSGNFNSPPDL